MYNKSKFLNEKKKSFKSIYKAPIKVFSNRQLTTLIVIKVEKVIKVLVVHTILYENYPSST